ncbi:hypothetical protein D3C85_1309560 [compost metagenome]
MFSSLPSRPFANLLGTIDFPLIRIFEEADVSTISLLLDRSIVRIPVLKDFKEISPSTFSNSFGKIDMISSTPTVG